MTATQIPPFSKPNSASTAEHLIRVRFAETDQMGIAHHSSYIVWLEAARIEWLRTLGLSYRELEQSGISLAVSEVQVRYRAAAFFDDELLIRTALTGIRSRRCSFSYAVYRPEDENLLATAVTLHTPTDEEGRALRLPDSWLSRLNGQLDQRSSDATRRADRPG